MLRRITARLVSYGLAGAAALALAADPCMRCHPKEASGYTSTPMAHSLSRVTQIPVGGFTHQPSGTKFMIKSAKGVAQITLSRDGINAAYKIDYAIGSGGHAYGYLWNVGDYLFQAPISFYSKRGTWDMAPGFESDPVPDFGRPVTAECLECHAGRPRPVSATLNRYENPPFLVEAISCDRCHGDPAAHLRNPSRQNIVNPARLPSPERESVCEQCHLSGQVRILNPGKQWGDFRLGQRLETVMSVYVSQASDTDANAAIKVISHAEQLALSACARKSGRSLWCGTCHDPHSQPERPLKYFRERCLECHAEKLPKTHDRSMDNCVGCHMPARPTRDGTHTVFTDHRITRVFGLDSQQTSPVKALRAWREIPGALGLRNLGLANIEVGEREHSSEMLELGARQAVEAMKTLPEDAVILTKVGLVLLRRGEAADAIEILEYAVKLDPERAGYHVNLGNAYKEAGLTDKAADEFERAIDLDPSLENAYRLLGEIYLRANNPAAARKTLERYLKFMPNSIAARKALLESAGN